MFEFEKKQVRPGSEEERLLGLLAAERMPRHVAVIMDGNGRWAKERGLPRIEGHRRGADSVRAVVENCRRLGIAVLTLYAFSSENWRRPKDEVDALMRMLSEFLRKEAPSMIKNGIAFQPLGRWKELPERTVSDIEWAVRETARGERMLLQVALNYGGRLEIVDACRAVAAGCAAGDIDAGRIEEDTLGRFLYNPDVPDPDLLIRTSGEYRISNFLLWQIAYAEIYITDVYWPEFRLLHLLESLVDFQARERRFGGLGKEGV